MKIRNKCPRKQTKFIVLLALCALSSPDSLDAQQLTEVGQLSSTEKPTNASPRGPQCNYYSINFSTRGVGGKNGSTSWDLSKSNLPCLQEILSPVIGNSAIGRKNKSWAATSIWDLLLRHIGRKIGDNDNEKRRNYPENKKYVDCQGKWKSPRGDGHNAHSMVGGGALGGNKGKNTPGCSVGKLFLNAACELQVVSTVVNVVGACVATLKQEIGTPVSLVWSEKYKDEPSTRVKFKLDPTSESQEWLWRASESLPLVVHDPKGHGVITSATQLFGPWFGGGKNGNQDTPWKNGYEALASLDRDHDGSVSKAELSEISLWFDKNRDGISQEGEVKRASSFGILNLYYAPDGEKDGAPFANRGFTRDVGGGKVISGSSMDWSEEAVNDVTSGGYGGLNGVSKSSELATKVSISPAAQDQIQEDVAKIKERIQGAWKLHFDHSDSAGAFMTFSSEEDDITGAVFRVNGLQNIPNVAAELVFAHFAPEFQRSENGELRLTFNVEGISGATLENTAVLSKDSRELRGTTTVRRTVDNNEDSYMYTWIGRRFE